MRAAIYVRVSTEEQFAEGYSIDAQKDILKDHCIAEDWEVVGIYEEEGYSGRTIKRPAYAKMMEEIDRWDLILVMKMDRIHRNSRNFMNMMDELYKRGKMFVSSTESLDTTTALGRFVVDMIERLAQLESEQVGERTYMGMREKAESMVNDEAGSRTLGFNPPFGYSLEDGLLSSMDDEMGVAKGIFDSYIKGSTMDDIAYGLNSIGCLTRQGNPWSKYSIRNILHNPIYAGYMRWDGVLIRHFAEAAVVPTDFNRVQSIMSSRSRNGGKANILLVPDDDFQE